MTGQKTREKKYRLLLLYTGVLRWYDMLLAPQKEGALKKDQKRLRC